MREGDTPLVKAVEYIGNWVATQRNHGEAHKAIPDSDLGDAWMVGALIVRLVDADNKKKTSPE